MMRITAALLVLIATLFGQQPAAPGPARTPELRAHGAFVAIVVQDEEASLKWYQSHLGLRLLKRSMSPRGHAGIAVLQGDGFFVELIHFVKPVPKGPEPEPGAALPPGIRKAGAVLEPQQFDALFSRLEKAGAKFRGGVFEDKEMKLRSFVVLDHEGNLIQFFTPVGTKP